MTDDRLERRDEIARTFSIREENSLESWRNVAKLSPISTSIPLLSCSRLGPNDEDNESGVVYINADINGKHEPGKQ